MAKKELVTGSGGPKDICFVIMPFGGWRDDYYSSIYCPAIAAADLKPHRADDLFRPSTIVNDIWAYTKRAKVLLADLTGKNPNVFYELGLAHALAKPAILIAESMEDIPFDLRALRIILYDKNAPDWGRILKEKIEASLKEVLVSPIEAVLPAFLDVKSAGTKPRVSAEQKDVIEIKQELELLRREMRLRQSDFFGAKERRIADADEASKVIENMLAIGWPENEIRRVLDERGVPVGFTSHIIASRGIASRPQKLTPVKRKPTLVGRVAAKPTARVKAKPTSQKLGG